MLCTALNCSAPRRGCTVGPLGSVTVQFVRTRVCIGWVSPFHRRSRRSTPAVHDAVSDLDAPPLIGRCTDHIGQRRYRGIANLQAGISQLCTTKFQKLNLALLAILITWAVLAMMCRHEKNQQAPCLEVVGLYDKYCLIRQIVVTRRLLRKTRYLRSDIFTLRSSF